MSWGRAEAAALRTGEELPSGPSHGARQELSRKPQSIPPLAESGSSQNLEAQRIAG